MSSARSVIVDCLSDLGYAVSRCSPNADAILRALDAAGLEIVDAAEVEELRAFKASLGEAAGWLSQCDGGGSGERGMSERKAIGPTKKVLSALEKVFAAEIDGRPPFQSKATIYRDLLAAGLVRWMERTIGRGWSAVKVSGYELTHAGRILYCANCEDAPDVK